VSKGYAFEQEEILQHRKRHISHYSGENVLRFLSPQFWTHDELLLYGDKCVYGVLRTITIVDICIVICFTSFAKAY